MTKKKSKARSVAFRGSHSRTVEVKKTTPEVDAVQQRHAKSSGQKFELTDVSNAKRLVARYGNDLRYCVPWRDWLIWDGGRWAVDQTQELVWRAKQTVLAMKHEAKAFDDEDGRRTELLAHCRRSQNVSRLKAMCEVAESEREVVITPEELDRNPFVLNCKNGTLGLQTGQLRKHRHIDLLTKITPVV